MRLTRLQPQQMQYEQVAATPQMFGAVGDGVADDTAALVAMFTSPFFTRYWFPKGTYLNKSIKLTNITKDISVNGEQGSILKLADNVRKNHITFAFDDKHTFNWSSVEIDGNWEGQGPETMTNGYINDVSHGLTVSRAYAAYLHDFYIHDHMGHHINHGGNTYFTAERIHIRAHPSALKPLGGARGDGITGCSKHVVIRDISGFSTDDFIAVVSGIDWIDGWYPNRQDVETILIENIKCIPYVFEGVTRHCHTAVSVGNSIGYSTNGAVVIRNIKGTVQSRGIGYTAESYGPDYYGQFNDSALISDVDLYVAGDASLGFTGRKNCAHIVIGCEGFNTASSSRSNYSKSVTLENIVCRGSAYSGTGIILGHMNIRDVSIDNLRCLYENATDNMVAIMIVGQKDLSSVKVNNVFQQVVGASNKATRDAKKIIESYYGANGAMSLVVTNINKQPTVANDGWLPNTVFLTATSQNRTIPRLFGKDLLCDLDSSGSGGVKAVPLVDGVNFSTPGLGHISYSKMRDAWTFHEFAVNWDTSNFGRPAAANFPNFSNFSWKAGTVVPVKGSPLQECQGYVCLSGTPTFDLVSNSFTTSSAVLQSSGWTPLTTRLTPGVRITSTIPGGSADVGWPVAGPGVVETFVSTAIVNGVNSSQEWRDGVNRKIRYWGGSTWGGWA